MHYNFFLSIFRSSLEFTYFRPRTTAFIGGVLAAKFHFLLSTSVSCSCIHPGSVNNILEKCSICMQTDYMLKRVEGLAHQLQSVVAFQIVIEATWPSSSLAFSLCLPSYKMNQFQDYAGCSTMGFIHFFCQNCSNLIKVFLVDFRWTCKCRKYWQEGIVPISVAVSSDS